MFVLSARSCLQSHTNLSSLFQASDLVVTLLWLWASCCFAHAWLCELNWAHRISNGSAGSRTVTGPVGLAAKRPPLSPQPALQPSIRTEKHPSFKAGTLSVLKHLQDVKNGRVCRQFKIILSP